MASLLSVLLSLCVRWLRVFHITMCMHVFFVFVVYWLFESCVCLCVHPGHVCVCVFAFVCILAVRFACVYVCLCVHPGRVSLCV